MQLPQFFGLDVQDAVNTIKQIHERDPNTVIYIRLVTVEITRTIGNYAPLIVSSPMHNAQVFAAQLAFQFHETQVVFSRLLQKQYCEVVRLGIEVWELIEARHKDQYRFVIFVIEE